MTTVHFAIFASFALFIICLFFAAFMLWRRGRKGGSLTPSFVRSFAPASTESPMRTAFKHIRSKAEEKAADDLEREQIEAQAEEVKLQMRKTLQTPKDGTPPPSS